MLHVRFDAKSRTLEVAEGLRARGLLFVQLLMVMRMALKSKKIRTTFLGASKFYCALLSAAKHMQDDPTFLLKRGYHVFPFSAAVIACHSRWIKCHESVVAPLFNFTDDDDKAFCLTILKAYGAAI